MNSPVVKVMDERKGRRVYVAEAGPFGTPQRLFGRLFKDLDAADRYADRLRARVTGQANHG